MITEYNQIDPSVKKILKKAENSEEITKDEALDCLGNIFQTSKK